MKKYTLDQAGVARWQNELYQSSAQAQQLEREFIHADFEGWLVDRFGATANQVDYLGTLSPDFVLMLRDELVLSLRAQLLIIFERQHPSEQVGVRSGDSVKVTEIKKWLEERGEGEEEPEEEEPTRAQRRREDETSRLMIRTYYRPS